MFASTIVSRSFGARFPLSPFPFASQSANIIGRRGERGKGERGKGILSRRFNIFRCESALEEASKTERRIKTEHVLGQCESGQEGTRKTESWSQEKRKSKSGKGEKGEAEIIELILAIAIANLLMDIWSDRERGKGDFDAF